MKEFFLFTLTFLDFWFGPLLIAFGVAAVIEIIIRRLANQEWEDDRVKVAKAASIRRVLWNYNLFVNISWFLIYFIMGIVFKTPTSQMPDMIWDGL